MTDYPRHRWQLEDTIESLRARVAELIGEASENYRTFVAVRDELAALKESQQEHWNEKRMDIIGQNGNSGDHYGEA